MTLNNLFIQKVELIVDPVDEYPFNIPAVLHLSQSPLVFDKEITFLVGENGSGKSTLLESIAINLGLNPEGGSKNFNFSTCNSHSVLHKNVRVTKGYRRPSTSYFYRSESFYNVASEIESLDQEPTIGAPIVNSYGGEYLHRKSRGESFMTLLNSRFFDSGLFLLDEPEAGLSVRSQLEVLRKIQVLRERGSQFIISTHSPFLVYCPDVTIYEVNNKGISEVNLAEELDDIILARSFMKKPDSFVREYNK